jgi:hypothetical protein
MQIIENSSWFLGYLEDSIAAILLIFTAIAAIFDCFDTPTKPYPLARDSP